MPWFVVPRVKPKITKIIEMITPMTMRAIAIRAPDPSSPSIVYSLPVLNVIDLLVLLVPSPDAQFRQRFADRVTSLEECKSDSLHVHMFQRRLELSEPEDAERHEN